MNLGTKRLVIRPSTGEDEQALFEMLSDQKTMMFFVEGTYTKNKTHDILKNNETNVEHYSVLLQGTMEFVGKISFHKWFMDDTYEIGWIAHPKHTNHGYITEAAKKLLEYGFTTLKLHRIIATCQPENIASKRVCEKLGMRLEGTFKQCIKTRDNIWWDELFYAILQEEYKHKQ